jgi:hypothetical protein
MNLPFSPRVLLIAPRFFGYEQEIVAELSRQGMAVDMLPDRPFDGPLMKAMMRLRPELGAHQASDRFFAEKIGNLGRSDYALILVIQGEGVTQRTLTNLRVAYPRARLVFYTWDSIENKPFSRRNLSLYDRCSTFDPVDATRFDMALRPLFFSPGFDRPAEQNFTYDLSFIGTVHSDRYKIVRALVEQLPRDTHSFVYLYLQAPWMYDLRRLFTNTVNGAQRNEFRFVPLTKDAVQATFFGSRAVVDIEHPNQRGATMRTFETLGSHRKMITTNASLRNCDFYDPRNILIVDRRQPQLDAEFLSTPYVPIQESIRSRYALKQWVREVCGSFE